MEALELANKTAIFEKLAGLRVINETIRCNDLIELVSTAISRDKRLINSYSSEQMVTRLVSTNGVLRSCRMFTVAGIERYVHEGRLYSYKNVCKYFGLTPINPLIGQLRKCMVGDQYNTKKVLKWLFDRRKQASELDTIISRDKLLTWLAPYKADLNCDKFTVLTEQS